MLTEIVFQGLTVDLKESEGYREKPYLCPKGKCSIGYGTNLEAHPEFVKTFSLPIYTDVVKGGFRGAQLCDKLTAAGMRWSKIKAESALEAVLSATEEVIERELPWTVGLDAVRHAVLLDMAYNMGVNKLLGFKKTLAYVQAGDWELAASEMLDSDWALQVKGRAIKLSNRMRLGEMV